MKKIAFIASVSFLTFACGGKTEKVTETAEPEMELAEPEAEPEVAEANGELVYKNTCLPCHGADGKLGVGGASDFSVSELSQEERVEVVTNGRNNMLAYGNILSEAEIAAVSEFVGTLKAE